MNIEKAPAWVAMLAALTCVCVFGYILNCGVGKTSCAVIDVAKTACDVLPIRYMSNDCILEHKKAGKSDEQIVKACAETEQVPREQLVGLAQAAKLQRLSREAADGGAD